MEAVKNIIWYGRQEDSLLSLFYVEQSFLVLFWGACLVLKGQSFEVKVVYLRFILSWWWCFDDDDDFLINNSLLY